MRSRFRAHRGAHCSLVLAVCCLLVLTHRSTYAQVGVQASRDGTTMLVSKDVGNERWAISYDLTRKTATGNVFFPGGGPPQFVWCEEIGNNGDSDPFSMELTLACYGADACSVHPCSSAQWNFLQQVVLPRGFFMAPRGANPTPQITSTPRPTPRPTADPLSSLLGTWRFETTIISVFFDHYRLERVETVNGTRVVVGTDLDDGGSIIAARIFDLTGSTAAQEFALLDPGTGICDFFVFDQTGPNTVAGFDILTTVSGGACDAFLTGTMHPMVGLRTSSAVEAAMAAPGPTALQLERESQMQSEDAATDVDGSSMTHATRREHTDVVRILTEALKATRP